MGRHFDKSLWLIVAYMALFTLVIGAGYVPEIVETVYSNGIFKLLRLSYDYSIGWIPFPSIYLWVLGLAIWLYYWITRENKWYNFLLALFIFLFIFFFSWGFNYKRPSLKARIGLVAPQPKIDALKEVWLETILDVDSLIQTNSENLNPELLLNLEGDLRESVRNMLEHLNYKPVGRPRVRLLKPKGSLLGFSTAGIYIPHAMEAHVEAGLHPYQWPFTMAHELTHAFGVTDEGECNLVALLTLLNSAVPSFRYSARLRLSDYVLRDIYRADTSLWKEFAIQQPIRMRKDKRLIRETLNRYPDFIPVTWRNIVYDQYLKSQGVQSGIQSYGEVLGLYLGWRKRELLE